MARVYGEGTAIRGFKHERACGKIARYAGLEAPGLVWWRKEGKGKPLSYEAFLEVEMFDNFLQGTAAATEEGALLFFLSVLFEHWQVSSLQRKRVARTRESRQTLEGLFGRRQKKLCVTKNQRVSEKSASENKAR